MSRAFGAVIAASVALCSIPAVALPIGPAGTGGASAVQLVADGCGSGSFRTRRGDCVRKESRRDDRRYDERHDDWRRYEGRRFSDRGYYAPPRYGYYYEPGYYAPPPPVYYVPPPPPVYYNPYRRW